MIKRIVSGGQTGADRAGLDAAIAAGVPHGGWCPRGRKAEDGPIPERYNLTETKSASCLTRTELNARDSDGTVILTMGALSGGSKWTAEFADKHGRPWLHLRLDGMTDEGAQAAVRAFVEENGIRALNVAGSRGSKEPELNGRVRSILVAVLRELGG
ncbi:putative molybdenum carrier protein [Haloferula sp. A504]|uniref:putative molybdenum carrier protein n=1 Tax=Haloferula sp. A504 TaxID=3373601 RepID=UPI0031C5D876|nr:putative molybdenum carrier protein [Verrucomicrobiaceae bacterium E54]